MKTRAPYRRRIAVRNVAWLAMAMIGSIALPASARSGEGAEDSAAIAVVRGPLGAALDEYLERGSRFGFAGAALVTKDGAVVLKKGYGLADRARGGPNTPETLFDVGSLAKSFTAAAVLRLEEQAKLKTTDSIGKHLAGVPPDKVPITIEHLLTHTAGLAGPRLPPGVDPTDRDVVVRALLAPGLLETPGDVPRYNNVNYFLLAAVVERASGTPLESYVRDHVFRPAGLRHTDFARGSGAPATPGAAHGYTAEGLDAGAAGTQPYHWLFRGATGVLSTAEDLGRWARALKGDAVLSAASREKMMRRGPGGYAFGWEIGRGLRGMFSFGLDGSTPSFESVFVCFPEHEGLIVLLCNNRGVAYHVKHDFLAAFVGEPYTAPPRTIRIDPMRLRACEGVYERPGVSKPLRFTVVGEELETDFALPARARFAPETETRFVTFDWVAGKPYHIDFDRAADGSVGGVTLLDLGEDLVFKKRPSR